MIIEQTHLAKTRNARHVWPGHFWDGLLTESLPLLVFHDWRFILGRANVLTQREANGGEELRKLLNTSSLDSVHRRNDHGFSSLLKMFSPVLFFVWLIDLMFICLLDYFFRFFILSFFPLLSNLKLISFTFSFFFWTVSFLLQSPKPDLCFHTLITPPLSRLAGFWCAKLCMAAGPRGLVIWRDCVWWPCVHNGHESCANPLLKDLSDCHVSENLWLLFSPLFLSWCLLSL